MPTLNSPLLSALGSPIKSALPGAGSSIPANAVTTDSNDPVVTTATSDFIITG